MITRRLGRRLSSTACPLSINVTLTRKIDEVTEAELRFCFLFLQARHQSHGVYMHITFFAMSFVTCRANT